MTMGNASTILRRCLIGFALIMGACVVLVIMYFVVFFGIIGYRMESSEPYDPAKSVRAAAPEWTPDGSRIIFGHWGGIYAVSQDGSSLSRIHGSDDDDFYHTPAIYGDGSRIAYSKYQGDERWERLSSALDGSDIRETSEDFDRGFATFAWRDPYSVSPNKSRIVFVESEIRGANNKQARVLYVSESPKEEDRSNWTELAEGDAIKSPRWSPDGSQLAFVKLSRVLADDHYSYVYKTQIVALSGSDLSTVNQVADGPGGYFDFKYVAGYVDSPYGFNDVAWSPDGTKLLVSGPSAISVVNVDGSDFRMLVKLRDNPIRQLHLSWSPDGSKIAVYNGNAYERVPFTEGALFTMSPDGSDKRVLIEYEDPLRLAQDQSWDPSFDAQPYPTPAPSATPNPATPAKPRAPASAPTPAPGSSPP